MIPLVTRRWLGADPASGDPDPASAYDWRNTRQDCRDKQDVSINSRGRATPINKLHRREAQNLVKSIFRDKA